MKEKAIKYFFYLFILGLTAVVSCADNNQNAAKADTSEERQEPVSVMVEAENFIEVNGEVKKEGGFIFSSSDKSWLSYEIKVPVAGRYKFEINAVAEAEGVIAWMEDYIDNKDDRNYNITGSISIPNSGELTTASVDGSPLNKGIHKVKLHLQGGKVKVDWFKFTLMNEHQKTPITLTQKTDGEEWKVVWSDEFDVDGSPDTSKWTFDIGNWGWGNNELQYYTEARPENARIENGNLIIEARKNDMNQKWTSARLTTRGKETFLFGRIEFRAKTPANKGNWAAGWTLGDDYVDELSWPYCGEIDIMESVGYEMNNETGNGKAHASVHCGAYYFKLNNHHTSTIDVKNMNNEYHTYAVDWTPEGITALVDGKEYFTYTDTANELTWPFDKPQNIILNLAMGGGWGDAQGMDETMTSQKLIIDYVRVYEKQ
jgi:beta-glucanase (GH16 family)